MLALIQYGTSLNRTDQFTFLHGPRSINHVIQSALRGGLTYDRCEIEQPSAKFIRLHFTEDTGAKTVKHWASVEFHDWDAIECQFVRELFTEFGAEEISA